MSAQLVTVHLDNGTSHTFEVPDAQHVLHHASIVMARGDREGSFRVGHALFNVRKVTFLHLGGPGSAP